MRVAVLARAEQRASGLGRGWEDTLCELQLPAGPVREWGEGRPSGPTGKEKERERVGRPTGFGLGFSFTVFPISISFLIQTTQTI